MRRSLFVSSALACLSACAQKDVAAPRDVTLTATLLDSLAARPVDSQKVYFTVGGRLDSVITNLSGGFAVTMPPGPVQITYADYGRYEDFDRTVTVGRDTAVVLRLRRTLPYLTDFAISAGVLSATIVDLQGAATIAHDNATWVVYQDPNIVQSSAIPSNQWTWAQMDAFTWRVSVATPSSSITAVIWNVMDDRYPTGFYCLAGQGTCTPDAP